MEKMNSQTTMEIVNWRAANKIIAMPYKKHAYAQQIENLIKWMLRIPKIFYNKLHL